MQLETRTSKTLKYAFLTLFTLLVAFPVYFALVSSLKSSIDVFLKPFRWPQPVMWENYPRAIAIGNIGVCFLNSIYITVVTMVVSALIGTMAGYVLSRLPFKGSKFWYVIFVAGMMIPMQSVIIPLSFVMGKVQVHDSYIMLMSLYIAFNMPMTVFITTNFLKGIPKELEEAALIDGSTRTYLFFRIIIPLSIPGITTASIFNFLGSWNNLLFPLVFVSKKSMQVIAIGLQSFFAQRISDYGGVMAAIIISILPPILAYVFLQEKVEEGMVAGAVKG
ncbi:MAG: carbohydrate ABC transporter permease [Spirochaetales bacterium]|nr:carbohydrate ABC transporter permease [Spirochaetales bacterium]